MGYDDSQTTAPSLQGLVRLYDYNVSQASQLMTDPNYTRAIFVRDPKERLTWAHKTQAFKKKCCIDSQNDTDNCEKKYAHFGHFLDLIQICDQPQWRPQGKRMEPKYFDTLNFVGQMDRYEQDANRLLKVIGAWKDYDKDLRETILRRARTSDARSYNFYGLRKICYGESESDYFYRADYGIEELNLTHFKMRECRSGVKPIVTVQKSQNHVRLPKKSFATRLTILVNGKRVYRSQDGLRS